MKFTKCVLLTKKQLNSMFTYRDGVLYNKYTRNPRALKGVAAGTLHNSGYLQTQINGRTYPNHRLIWFMFNDTLPVDMEVDHINHNRLDNRLENLRLVSLHTNRKNQTLNSKNTSGVNGVYFIKRLHKWGSQIKVNKKVIWLGSFANKSDAIEAREHADKLYKFHKNHGSK